MIGTELAIALTAGCFSIGGALLVSRHLTRRDVATMQAQIDETMEKVSKTKHSRLPECDKELVEIKGHIDEINERHTRIESLIQQSLADAKEDRNINGIEHKEFRKYIEAITCDAQRTKDRVEKVESKFAGQQGVVGILGEQTKNLEKSIENQNKLMGDILGSLVDIVNNRIKRK